MTPAKPLPLVVPIDVDHLAGLEGVDGELLAERCTRRRPSVRSSTRWRRGVTPALAKWPACGLVHLARVDRAERDLDGGVAVVLRGADLGDDAGPGLDHGHGDDAVVLVPDLGHAELLAQQALHVLAHGGHVVPQSLISMSTPAGRSSRMSESTVFGVGSRMSMSRLWVRISKCSRLSLYLCGERMTQ